jgi:uncharacterized protein (DUF433 family)
MIGLNKTKNPLLEASMETLAYAHIQIDSSGVPMLAGTTIKVVEIALDFLAYRWDAEEIQRQHPHLSLGQIHSALAYYFDHRQEMDAQISKQLDEVDDFRRAAEPSPVTAKLVKLGLRT